MKEGSYQHTQYMKRYDLDGWLCQGHKCENRAVEMAHRIANTVINRKKYGLKKIHNYINLTPVCCKECNDSKNIGNRPYTVSKLIYIINRFNNKNLTSKEVEALLYD